jgi:hypothetical protein
VSLSLAIFFECGWILRILLISAILFGLLKASQRRPAADNQGAINGDAFIAGSYESAPA